MARFDFFPPLNLGRVAPMAGAEATVGQWKRRADTHRSPGGRVGAHQIPVPDPPLSPGALIGEEEAFTIPDGRGRTVAGH
ncbi:MAG: hypothetical protein ACE5JX_15030 [Acidobacteriota bacterium]